MSRAGKVAKSTIIIMIFILVSKILGFSRDILIASNYGAGEIADTFLIVFKASSIAIVMINSVVHTTLLPVLTEISAKKGRAKEIEFVNEFINGALILTGLIAILGWIFSPLIIKILAPAFVGEQFKLAVELNRIGFPMIILVAAASTITIFLQKNEEFTIPAATGLPLNITYIVFLVFLSHRFGIKGLMYTVLIAHSTQLFFQLPYAYKMGFRYKFKISRSNPYLKKTLLLSAPIIIGAAIQQINTIIDRNIASRLEVGSISALTYAVRLEEFIVGVFIVAVSTVFFPMLTREFENNDYGEMKNIMGYGINFILMITIPATIGIILLAFPIVELLFQRNAFDQRATFMTANALIFYSVGLPGIGVREMLLRMFYSLQDTKTPMKNGIIAVIINITLNLILVRFMQHRGLALATGISALISATLLTISLKKKMGTIGGTNLLSSFLKITLASLAMGIIVFLLKPYFIGNFSGSFMRDSLQLGIIILIGVVSYFSICYILKIRELRFLFEIGIEKIRRL
ncbi:murein biosynthesis integral membrane protein MurJ [Alkaliphilus peptidifermentans]|uniref:Probable lipid II flippase MurJ n=1 Tax=Alkaliphilus peptidifermentans DSM 18978 TaxID=1120976 RepID=A0A1G5JFH0_9FIRM|nr:murein biosynthesis integral membrane protein MurJ [Alkaliphilus peptidifermentans]SCY87106.1 putative peptidoglycan lipid II flippase [Alkaliphilus peptidifermentans DSM 18978]